MLVYDKDEIKNALTLDNHYELLVEWGGDPEYTSFGIISATICHNMPGEGSRKLYLYSNTMLYHCYTGCEEPTFDIFQLVIKIQQIQHNKVFDLNDAVRWIAQRFGLSGKLEEDDNITTLADWNIFANYAKIDQIELKSNSITLKEYDKAILSNLNYKVRLAPWLNDNITQEIINHNQIGYLPSNDMITIPHFDENNRLVGLRGRVMCQEEAEKYGKYRPIKLNNIWYNHPLSMNLYNLNNSLPQIKILKKAIIFESEKSTLQFQSYFGIENDISVACCGSSISIYQIEKLLSLGVTEIIVAFDRQFQELGDKEHRHLVSIFNRLHSKYHNYVTISFIFDRDMITKYKASPVDEGPEKFLTLFNNRVIL